MGFALSRDMLSLDGGFSDVELPSLYVGQVATKCGIPTNRSTTNKQANSRTHHRTTDAISALQIEDWNGYWPRSTFGPEAGGGGNLTIERAIEYPEGVLTRVQYSGVNSSVLASNAIRLSDSTAIQIPKNTDFWLRSYVVAATAIVFTDGNASPASWQVDFANGEAYEYGPSGITNKVMGGTITHNLGEVPQASIFRPMAIVGQTRKGTCAIYSNSRDWGYGDNFDGTGGIGNVPRGLHQLGIGHINLSSPGDSFSGFIGSHAKRVLSAQHCSHVYIGDPINGLRVGGSGQGKTAAAVIAELQTIMSYFPGKRIILGTPGGPNPSSSNSFINDGGQTVSANHAEIVAYADTIRAGGVGAVNGNVEVGYWEIDDVLQHARNSGKWWTNGEPFATTLDGLHNTQLSYQRVRDSGAITATLLSRAGL